MLRFHALLQRHSPDGDGGRSLAVTFDSAVAEIARLPRLFIEPDGSFVWRGTSDDGQSWQVDGNLIDRGEVLDYVELKGWCPSQRLDEILAALGWPQTPLAFQLPRQGVTLTEEEFRQRAAGPEGAV